MPQNGATGDGRPKHKVVYAHNGIPVKNAAAAAAAAAAPPGTQPAKVMPPALQGHARLDRPITHASDMAS
jgi:hypothetical protein